MTQARNSAHRLQPRDVIVAFALLIVAILPYLQVRGFEFITYDDRGYIWDNPNVLRGLSSENMRWAFTTTEMFNWHPLTWLSHMLDVTIHSTWPGGHHLTNVGFHALNAALVFVVLARMTGSRWRSALVAALFALHPLHVESVAWISERKDVLSTFFGLLAIWAYVGYVERRQPLKYALLIMAFALSLLSKPMLVTLPFVLLLFDVWPLRRFAECDSRQAFSSVVWRALLEKAPLLVLSIASSVMTLLAQRAGGSVQDLVNLPLGDRLANVLVSYATYIVKTVWPADLALLYPLPSSWPAWQVLGSIALLAIITIISIRLRKRMPWLLIGWLFFLGTLVPVIGFVHVGSQSMADRYTYVPLLGLFVMFAWSLPEPTRDRIAPVLSWLATGAALAALGLCAWLQASYWRDSFTLFTRTLQVTSDNAIANMHVGMALEQRNQISEAMAHYREAARIQREYRPAHLFLAEALVKAGQHNEAIDQFGIALRLGANEARVHHGIGKAYFNAGRIDQAISHYRIALQHAPRDPEVNYNLGVAMMHKREAGAARGHFVIAASAMPQWFDAQLQLGIALAADGHLAEAIDAFNRAVALRPNDVQAQSLLQQAREHINQIQREQSNPQ